LSVFVRKNLQIVILATEMTTFGTQTLLVLEFKKLESSPGSYGGCTCETQLFLYVQKLLVINYAVVWNLFS